jgi:hypothetical protein
MRNFIPERMLPATCPFMRMNIDDADVHRRLHRRRNRLHPDQLRDDRHLPGQEAA